MWGVGERKNKKEIEDRYKYVHVCPHTYMVRPHFIHVFL